MPETILGEEVSNHEKRCSFCMKLKEDVKGLVAGPGVSICNECVELCNDLFKTKKVEDKPAGGRSP